MEPLSQPWTPGHVFGTGFPTLRQNKTGQGEIRRAECGGHPARALRAEEVNADAAERRAENESQSEGHSDQSHSLRAFGSRSYICDVGLGHCDISAADAGKDPRAEQEPQSGVAR